MKKRSSRNGATFGRKIKTEHSIVPGLFELLQELAGWEEIASIIPGRIMRRGNTKRAEIRLTIPTQSGWKALGKSKGATQELFIVTGDPDAVRRKIQARSGTLTA
jgi:hypothetical protein